MLNENVRALFKAQKMWDLATCADNVPNVVTVAFTEVTDDGKLLVGDVFLDTTLANLAANRGRIAVTAHDPKSLEGYQIKGTAAHVARGEIVDAFQKIADTLFHGAMKVKGALVITPETVIVTTPGPENKKTL